MCKQCINKIKNQYQTTVGVLAISRDNMFNILDNLDKCPAMKSLEELTVGGSEFYEDPAFCLKFIKNRRDNIHNLLVEKVKELKTIRDERSLAKTTAFPIKETDCSCTLEIIWNPNCPRHRKEPQWSIDKNSEGDSA